MNIQYRVTNFKVVLALISLFCSLCGVAFTSTVIDFDNLWSIGAYGVEIGQAANTGDNQIVIGVYTGINGYLAVMNNSWQVTWYDTLPTNMSFCTAIAIGDADNDGSNELLAFLTGGNSGPGVLRIYKYSGGTYLLNGQLPLDAWVRDNALKIGDVDNDDSNEIVIGQDFYARRLQVYSYSAGNFFLEWSDNLGSDVRSVEIGDTDNDAENELLVGTGNWSAWDIRVYDGGSLVWNSSPIARSEFTGVTIGDANNDDNNEIAGSWYGSSGGPAAGDTGGIVVYHWDGGNYTQFWRRDFSGKAGQNILISDVDRDGLNEVLCLQGPSYFSGNTSRNISDWVLQVYDDSSLSGEKVLDIDGYQFYTPSTLCCLDIDGNGSFETVASNAGEVFVLHISSIPGIHLGKSKIEIEHKGLFVSRPNPLRYGTELKYEISKTSYVSLNVYNTIGQKVRTLVNEKQKSGKFTIWWDGTNDQGKDVPSGNYFYKLNADGKTILQKAIVLR